MSNYKRQFRELDDSTKQKISKASKGKAKSMSHRQHLSQALTRYWLGVKSRDEHLTMDEYFGLDKNNEDVKLSNTNERE